ncbi:(2Fe-2S) ferredoxin domain-containing protein [Aminithiophilus ramosus]|uniref:(2Fe-2S) ferredoxin domain-containing protein n=2 Tax=Synergistales TaxID=649776 RepID=A0A9Q7EZP1_9BACT|nr:(2Fe-2S) ferredoxin domain-containing protein [Aminithiophilus ramosus]QTX32412.1 (2Fe-2S) ferredoxin domain-containing protein [Aminithiophilus ramosus]QVL36289.1 (2Fe-2S) ferredoxin domain-containing protein [Synergistota bacterium]
MAKIGSLEELRKLKEKTKNATELREKGHDIEKLVQVKVSMATCGIASGARETLADFMRLSREKGIENIVFTQTGCMGYCHSEPTVEVTKPGEDPIVFGNVKGDRVREIVEKYILKGELVADIIPTAYKTIDQ